MTCGSKIFSEANSAVTKRKILEHDKLFKPELAIKARSLPTLRPKINPGKAAVTRFFLDPYHYILTNAGTTEWLLDPYETGMKPIPEDPADQTADYLVLAEGQDRKRLAAPIV